MIRAVWPGQTWPAMAAAQPPSEAAPASVDAADDDGLRMPSRSALTKCTGCVCRSRSNGIGDVCDFSLMMVRVCLVHSCSLPGCTTLYSAAQNLSPPARIFVVFPCFSVFSCMWGNPEVGGGDNCSGSYVSCTYWRGYPSAADHRTRPPASLHVRL